MSQFFRYCRVLAAGSGVALLAAGSAQGQSSIETIIQDNVSSQQPGNSSAVLPAQPLDLTVLAPADDGAGDADNNSADAAATEDPAADGQEALPAPTQDPVKESPIVVSTGLTLKKPSSVRLASLGVDRAAVDGLDRLMWGQSQADSVRMLYRMVPRNTASPVLNQRLGHVMLSRAVPPEGSVDLAETMIEQRLAWLKPMASADDLAELIRQLPDADRWQDWKRWLVLHDLITRNDEAACSYATAQTATTLEPLWHQINAFCQVIRGDMAQASFALDILEDRGVDDPVYFNLMRKLTGSARDAATPDAAPYGPLNLVLMDSARVEITSAALQSAPDHRTSLAELRYLAPDAAILLGARAFDDTDRSISDIIAAWALLPVAGVPSSEALTQLSLGGSGDEISLARFLAWQATALEKDDAGISDIALMALSSDYRHGGSRSLQLWLPFINAREGDPAFLLYGLVPGSTRLPLNGEALAWSEILAFSARPISASSLVTAGAIDAIPMLDAIGVATEPVEWSGLLAENRRLASAETSLDLPRLMALEAAADRGDKAETLLLAALALGEVEPWKLGRDDAARLTGALSRAGLKETARQLAREILQGWVMHRYFTPSDEADATAG